MAATRLLILALLCIVHLPASAAIVDPPRRVSVADPWEDYEPVLAASPGVLVAAWSVGTINQSILTAYSLDGGDSWVELDQLLRPAGTARVYGETSLCSDGAGNFYLAGIVNASPGLIFVAVWRGSVSGPDFSWSAGVLATPTCVINSNGFTSNPCWEMPSITCIPGTDDVVLSMTHVSLKSRTLSLNTIECVRSTDGGQSWSAPIVISSPKSKASALLAGTDGTIHAVWRDFGMGTVQYAQSLDGGVSFGSSGSIATMIDNSASGPPGYRPRNRRENPVYITCSGVMTSNDYPTLAIDNTGGPKDGMLYVAWAERASGTIEGPTDFTFDSEPNDWLIDATPVSIGQTIYGVIAGEFNGGPDRDHFYFEGQAGQTIYLRGDMTATSGTTSLGDMKCNRLEIWCDRDTNVCVARAGMQESIRGLSAPIYYTLPYGGRYFIRVNTTIYNSEYTLTLRDFTISPSSIARDHRDIVLCRSADGGASWSPKERVGGGPGISDDSLPSLIVDQGGDPVLAWYATDLSDACSARFHTRASWVDAESQADRLVRASSVSSSWQEVIESGPPAGGNVGDRLGMTASESGVHVAWMQRESPDANVYATRIQAETPVALPSIRSLTAAWESGVATVRWHLGGDLELSSVEVRRSPLGILEGELVDNVSIVPGWTEYSVVDHQATAGVAWTYTLIARHRDGTTANPQSVTLDVAVASPPVPRLELAPNPFSNSLRVAVTNHSPGAIIIAIHDVTGRQVRTHQSIVESDRLVWEWDGMIDSGARAPSGIYLVRVTSRDVVTTGRILRYK